MTGEEYQKAVLKAKEHILAGDIFQIVLSQRFERRTFADPFEVYRALRIVNPSPYMTYLQVCGPFLKLFFLLDSYFLICFLHLMTLALVIRQEAVSWLLQALKFLLELRRQVISPCPNETAVS